ncbi:MAG: indole-3-glycerol phosphate synthase TrpC [Marinilabiliaceae bacterium]|nr:indole-3-glycerol phosphate synthase TrpC [Marinilabiliaceae bacterium]
MNYLDKIIASKIEELKYEKSVLSVDELKDMISNMPPTTPFAESIRVRNGIIAEFKRKSPSKGIIHNDISPRDVVPYYEKAGVSAVSVLTNREWFGGEIKDLKDASESVGIPILRKEFIVDSYQVYEARAFGASAILLIAAVLERSQARDLAAIAKELGMEVLMELHGEDEFGYIVDGVTVAGINNRNLKTFEVDLEHSVRMSRMLPDELPKISESGIRSVDDMRFLRERGGFDGFLIGENFMCSSDPGRACIEFCKSIDWR